MYINKQMNEKVTITLPLGNLNKFTTKKNSKANLQICPIGKGMPYSMQNPLTVSIRVKYLHKFQNSKEEYFPEEKDIAMLFILFVCN